MFIKKRRSSLIKYSFMICLACLYFIYVQHLKQRPTVKQESNIDHHHRDKHIDYWNKLSDGSIEIYKSAWQDFIQKTKTRPIPTFNQDRGIVFVAGNDDTLQRTLGTIRLLRYQYNCTLSIEIWHMEHEAPKVETFRPEIDNFSNVTTKDFSDYRGAIAGRSISRMRNHGDKQFQVKAAAILYSDFKQVLYLDSDNIPTRDPSYLFETDMYKQHGAVFWPDFWKTARENKIFRILDIDWQDTWEQESGQLMMDKHKNWAPLSLAWYMQFYHEVYFRLLNGDKDTFQYAFKAMDAPFYRIKTLVAMGGFDVEGKFCGHSMLQYDDKDKAPLFVHANLLKQMPLNDSRQVRPWSVIHTSLSASPNPAFYMNVDNMGCMTFDKNDAVDIQHFDHVLPTFQDQYFKYN